MKKFLILALTLLLSISLFSCEDDHIPDGMQLVSGGEDKGYYFYAPEEWTVSNTGNVDLVYASTIDDTCMLFAEVDPTTFKTKEGQTNEEYFFSDYFKDSLSEFPATVNLKISTPDGTDDVFGFGAEGADKARRYVYEYTIGETPIGFIQILLTHEDGFYIFTYKGQKVKRMETDESTRYDMHLEKFEETIKSFRFVTKTTATPHPEEYQKDADGYVLATDKSDSGFEFYVPASYKIDYSSGIVSATHGDGSNVNMSISHLTITDPKTFWDHRLDELSNIVTNIERVSAEPTKITFGNNCEWAYAYEYTFMQNGSKYHVYQIIAIDKTLIEFDMYTFTYTAKEENYQKHFAEVEKIISKVVF